MTLRLRAAGVPVCLLTSLAGAQTMPDYVDVLPLAVPTDAWVWAGSPPGDASRLFIMEGGGTIRIVDIAYPPASLPTYNLRATPFLTNPTNQARSVEFAPDFATSGKFYVAHEYTGNNSRITEFTVSSADPNVANPASARVIRNFPGLNFDHALGSMHFARDGTFMFGCGDGMTGSNAQSLTTLLGKMLRIDVTSGIDDYPADAGANYHVPADNPLVGRPNVSPEIWAIGIRNPWRWSFDRWSGDFWEAEVGGGLPGEINYGPGIGPPYRNYGWPLRDGNNVSTNNGLNPDFTLAQLTYPLYAVPRTGSQCSTSGGAMYRGNDIRPWRGRYIWGDYCSRQIYSMYFDGTTLVDLQTHTTQLNNVVTGAALDFPSVSMIAEDGAGELYILQANRGASSGGVIYRIVAAGPQPPIADTGQQGGLPGTDGHFDNNDFVVFIDWFFTNDPRADMGAQGGLRAVDQRLDNNDFVVFIDAFFSGN